MTAQRYTEEFKSRVKTWILIHFACEEIYYNIFGQDPPLIELSSKKLNPGKLFCIYSINFKAS